MKFLIPHSMLILHMLSICFFDFINYLWLNLCKYPPSDIGPEIHDTMLLRLNEHKFTILNDVLTRM